MSDDRYSPPAAEVADVPSDTLPRRRPVQVTVAVILMWVTFLFGMLGIAAGWNDFMQVAPRMFLVIISISAAVIALLNIMTMLGRNWARISYLVFFCIGLPRLVEVLPPLFAESVVSGLVGVMQVLVQLTALVLLFTSPGRHWFRRAPLERLLFSYGSLQKEEVQRATVGRTLAGRHDELLGFELSTSRGPAAHANVIRSARPDDRVGGMVFEVTDAELARVDDYERRDGYERIEAALASGARCWVYREAPVEAVP